jgi:DNA-directed RNA polymerase subunit RPC12/RpoP
MDWLRRLRLKVFGVLLAVALTCMALLSAGVGWFSIPVVGAALWAVVATVNRATAKASITCWSCGMRLDPDQLATGDIACPKCGTLRQPGFFDLAGSFDDVDEDLSELEFEERDAAEV